MAERYVAVLDAGTSSIRCFVFDGSGRIVASRSAGWMFTTEDDASPYAREFDTAWLWGSLRGLLEGALKDSAASPDQVAAVTATSQRQAVVFLDAGGEPVHAGPNLDLRAVFEGGAIDEEMGKEVYETTGHAPSFLLAPAKLRWFQNHRPEAYGRITTVLPLADWVLHKLSGATASEPSLAAEAGLLDIATRGWCSDLLSAIGVPENSNVPLVPAGSVIGDVVSKETGLPTGTPVAVAGADTQCGLLGMGTVRAGQAGVVAGWSVPLQLVTTRPVLSLEARTWAGCHLTDGLWTLESSAGDAGNSYRWLADTFWGELENPYQQMDQAAAEVPPGADGAVAYLVPPRMDMSRVGMRRGGFLFPVPLTVTDLGRGHLTRAALEGIAFAVRANLEQAEELLGAAALGVTVGGGMTRTATWVRVLANVLGRPLRVSPAPGVTAVGAYLCVATALGEFASLVEAGSSVASLLLTVEPDPSITSEYEDLYQHWLETAGRLDGFPI